MSRSVSPRCRRLHVCATAMLIACGASVGAGLSRRAPSRWSCRIRRAAASMCWRASSPTSCRARSASRSSSTTAPAAAAPSAPARSSAGGARRLHAVARPHRHDLDQSEPLCQRRLRSAQGFRADRADRLDAGRAARASVVPGQDDRRRDRAWPRRSRGKFNIGTSAVGTGGYLSAELFKSISRRRRRRSFPTRARRR